MIKITCDSCHKPLTLDESKLPPQRVSFPCPSCKAKLSIDKREFEPGGTVDAVSGFHASQPDNSAGETDDDHDHLGDKAVIVGTDSQSLRQVSKSINLQPVFFGSVESARDFFVRELPPVVFLNPAQLTAPPLTEFAPILSLTPADRRRGFFILVAENLRTFDGNAAFLYGVNLIVSTKDLGSFGQIYRDAEKAHRKLYAAMSVVTT
jgi:hypothetical protein